MNILEKYSITPKHLINSVDDLPTIPVNKFSIELAIELYNFAKKHQLEIGNCLSKWVTFSASDLTGSPVKMDFEFVKKSPDESV
jgi:hypothetical protein